MLRFKEFINKLNLQPTIISALPMHGQHAFSPLGTIISALPVHGQHSEKCCDDVVTEDSDHNSVYDWNEHNENDHLGGSTFDVHDKLNHSHEHINSLPDFHHVYRYSDASHETNGELVHRATGVGESSWKPEHNDSPGMSAWKKANLKQHDERVAGIDKTLAAHSLDHDLHVYHGTHAFHPGEEAARGGGRITLPAYTSTSISKSTAARFSGMHADTDSLRNPTSGRHIIHIHAKKGQHGMYLGDHSSFPEEQEYLMPRNTTLQIHPEPSKLKTAGGNDIHVWHAHVVHPEKGE